MKTYRNILSPALVAGIMLAGLTVSAQSPQLPFFTYTADTLPAEDGWAIRNFPAYEPTAASIVNGRLHINDASSAGGSALVYGRTWNPIPGYVVVAELDVSVMSASGIYGMYFATSDGFRHMAYQLLPDRIIPSYRLGGVDPTEYPPIMVDMTSEHTLRAEIDRFTARLYIDGRLVFSDLAGDGRYNITGITFGAGASASTGEGYFNEIRCYQHETSPNPVPEPQPEPIPEPVPEPQPDPTPVPEPEPVPEPIPEPDPIPEPEPDPDPIPEPEPVPEPEPEPEPDPQDETKVEGILELHPHVLSDNSQGKWITATVELPSSFSFCDLDQASILLDDFLPPDRIKVLGSGDDDRKPKPRDGDDDDEKDDDEEEEIQGVTPTCDSQVLLLKFDRQAFADAFGEDYGRHQVFLTADFSDGSLLEASDELVFKEHRRGRGDR